MHVLQVVAAAGMAIASMRMVRSDRIVKRMIRIGSSSLKAWGSSNLPWVWINCQA
jgi:hypothetical protein